MRSALLAASLAGALALSGYLAEAADAQSVVHHASATGQVALQGQVIDSTGHGLTGAKIELYAWPGAWPGRQRVHRGERVPLRFIGQSFSTAEGRYAVRISHPAALKASALRDGTVNLQVVVAGSKTWYEFPSQIITTSKGKRLTPKTVVLRVQGSTWKEAAKRDSCDHEVSVFDKNYRKEWGIVDQTYERRSGISATSKLTNGQTTTFSVGISGSGDAGTFTASSHFSLGDTVTTQFKTFAGPATQSYQANFTPSEYTHWLNPGMCFEDDYTQPSVQDDGARKVSGGSVPRTPTRYCDLQSGVASKTYSSATAATISSGLKIAEIGFSASTQTGWTTNDVIKYINTSGRNFHTCGQSGDPGNGSPGRVVTGLPNGGR